VGGPAGQPGGSVPGGGKGPAGGKTMRTTERVGSNHPFGGAMSGGKAEAFGPAARRLMGRLAPVRAGVIAGLVNAVVGLALAVAGAVVAVLGTAWGGVARAGAGPRAPARATDLGCSGIIGRQLPAGISRGVAVAGARAAGESQIADLLSGIDLVPGQGVVFDAV